MIDFFTNELHWALQLMVVFFSSFIWFGYWGAESGASLPWSKKWQKGWGLPLGQLSEMIFAISVAGAWCFIRNVDEVLPLWVNVHDVVRDSLIVYAGKQAATWALLSNVMTKGYQTDTNNDGVVDYDDGRKSKIKNIVDDLADSIDVPITSPKYGVVWAFTKGALMTLPIGLGVIGGVFHALGHWVAVKVFYDDEGRGKVSHPNAYKEWIGTGLCLGGLFTIIHAIKLIF